MSDGRQSDKSEKKESKSTWRFPRKVLLALMMVLPFLLLVDVISIFHRPLAAEAIGFQLSASKSERSFLLKQYDTAVAEIRNRIEHEHLLFILKFMVVGAVLGVVFGNPRKESDNPFGHSNRAAVCGWCAVAVAAIVDVRIQFNTQIIMEQGNWVKALESAFLTSPTVKGWEHFFQDSSALLNAPISPLLLADRQLLTYVLYLVVLYVFVPSRSTGEQDRWLLETAHIAIPCCMVLFGCIALHFHPSSFYILAYVVFVILWGCVVSHFWIRSLMEVPQKDA